MNRPSRKTIKSFLDRKGISVHHFVQDYGKFYTMVHTSAYRSKKTNGAEERQELAEVTAFSRMSRLDFCRGSGEVGEKVAKQRALHGLYNLLRGKEIHDPLCQGERYE